ncbi:TonB-dependent receptor [Catalinimonas niigatensis]|uniref:TonB-dependent receptor n=1 Tax=Catalinimonas niigatensis TaxID=1397264 RepID=UPI002665619C|nr:TonB-dependent receptor [Catalinimonas niigatensis]WPP53355.1 TonB-dependent receptor [Catalinimonas niigatensis]
MKKIIFTSMISFIAVSVWAQEITQTVRGRIVDTQSDFPLMGVNVVIAGSSPLIGTSTDEQGYYRLSNVPIGRQTLKISFMGYEEQTVPNIIVTSGKEAILNFKLEEKILLGQEIVITAAPEKTSTNNELTSVSARSFNLEETGRYAGSRNDPARMAANFAGVAANNDDRNDIVIRGNSPSGLLWRLEGINIPNPSHYGSLSATGGPVSMLNYNMLDKSDFLTAAFPAEYGNALAGVFDLQLRSGNNEKREYLGQIGFNGFELGAEGPFTKNSKASYVANYRYSTLGAFQAVGIDFGTGAATPEYQDLTFKVDVPTAKAGRFTLFGIGGFSSIDLLGSEEDLESTDNLYGDENFDNRVNYRTGIVGLSHLYYFNSSTYYKLSLAASRQEDHFRSDSLSIADRTPIPSESADFINNKYSAHLMFNKKFNARNTVSAGTILDLYDFDLLNLRLVPGDERTLRNSEGQSLLTQVYAQWQHRFSDRLTLNMGINYQDFEISGSQSVGPRAGLQYALDKRQTIGVGYGRHSQMQPLESYFIQTTLADGTVLESNRDMEFTHSDHFVLSYNNNLRPDLRLKVETYYQDINNAAVESSPSSFSMLNAGSDFAPVDEDFLVNAGIGRNYGVELTLEKFYSQGYYFLLTTSLYKSEYQGSDGLWRSTAFDGGYIANLLGGKEFKMGRKENTLNIDIRMTTSGGNKITPIDFEQSAALGYEVLLEDQAFSAQLNDYLRADLKISYRINTPKATHEFGVDLQNITNNENEFARTYNPRTNKVQTQYQIGFFPVPQYRLLF